MSFSYENIPDTEFEDAVNEMFGGQVLVEKSDCFNFVCPTCGDLNFPNKKKAYVYKDTWRYICYKCGVSQHFMQYIKEHDEDRFGRMLLLGFDSDSKPKQKKEVPVSETKKIGLPFMDGEIIPITCNHPLAVQGKQICIDRKIRPMVYEKWFVCLNDKRFLQRDPAGNLILNSSGYPIGNEYRDRIIIPFYRFGGAWNQFDARAIDPNNTLRYRNFEGVKRTAYNIDFVDFSKPFYILEGTIDSTFIRNSIAIGGIQHLGEVLNDNPQIAANKDKCTIIWDNDPPGQKAMVDTTKKGFGWFDWNDIKAKDINGAVMAGEMPLDSSGYVDPAYIQKYSMRPEGSDILFALKFGDVEKKAREEKMAARKIARDRLSAARRIGVVF